MPKKKQTDLVTASLTLPQIVKKTLRASTPFEELWSGDKTRVLLYIKNHNLDLRVFGKRGFDILKNAFFIFEYELIDGECQKNRKDFPDFDSYYQYARGDIYESSCYYGYHFSKKEEKKYAINCSIINYDSFDKSTIVDLDTQQSVEFGRRSEILTRREQIEAILKRVDSIHSSRTFAKELNHFKSLFAQVSSSNVEHAFYALVIKKNNALINSFVLQKGLSIQDTFFFFGREKAEEKLIATRPISFSEFLHIRYDEERLRSLDELEKRAQKISYQVSFGPFLKEYESQRRFLKSVLEEKNHIRKRGGFSNSLALYYITYDICRKEDVQISSVFVDFVFSFEEFARELDGDLSGCDLVNAPVTIAEINRYKTDYRTRLPISNECSSLRVSKRFQDNSFNVTADFYNSQNQLVRQVPKKFEWFCDFVHYLNGDLSNADLIMCDGIENIVGVSGLKLDGIKVKSDVAKKLNLPLDLIPVNMQTPVSLEQTVKNETNTDLVAQTMHETECDYADSIAYLSDLHLLHRFAANHCKTNEDCQYVLRKICRTIKNDSSEVCLIGGDISSDFSVFRSFVSNLATYHNPDRFINTQLFFTIGNHELWAFPNNALSETVSKYRSVLQENGMYLVQNNLYYYSCEGGWKEVPTNELESISEKELRNKTRGAFLIIFGGMGFAGNNTTFNANQGIYRGAVDREQEISECEKFNKLHRKVSRALYDKNVIVFTHMPIDDWLLDQKTTDRFVYVNGHRHINKYFDDGIKRIYSDNQIGYKRKEVSLKHFSINMEYNWFSDYPDGIHEITADDYRFFYRGINQGIDFNRDFSKIYMLKREQTYMFVAEKENGKRFLLMGGHIKTLTPSSLEYYYEKMLNYSESVRLFVSDYFAYQKRIAEEVKRIGGEGFIHGCIIDIDGLDHLYINPLDGKITPYYALSMVDKILYKNLPSLLKEQCPNLYLNYVKAIQDESVSKTFPVLYKNNQISNKTIFEPSTEMYRASRILKKLQTLVEKKVIQIWNDEMAGTPSKEIGKTITQGLLESVADKKLN